MELSGDVNGSVGVDEVEEGIERVSGIPWYWYCCVLEDAVFALKSLVLVGELRLAFGWELFVVLSLFLSLLLLIVPCCDCENGGGGGDVDEAPVSVTGT